VGENSGIEWTHHTFNPWWGCLKVSPACDHCYAETWAKRWGSKVWGKETERRLFGDAHWNEPLKWDRAAEKAGERHRVFCSSMADVMEDREELFAERDRLWDLIERTPHLDWLLLTKRPQNFARFFRGHWLRDPRPNVWLLTTVESDAFMWRVEALLEVRAVLHGVSYEPALGPADFSPYLPSPSIRRSLDGRTLPSLGWIIGGGESGPGARPPHPDWFRAVRDDCAEAGVPFLLKQWGEYQPLTRIDGVQETPFGDFCPESGWGFIKKGTKTAGKLLDGREHLEYPAVRP
jgi:protein gp37